MAARRRQQFNGTLSTPDDVNVAAGVGSSMGALSMREDGGGGGGVGGVGKGRPPHMLEEGGAGTTNNNRNNTANTSSSQSSTPIPKLHLHGNVKSSVNSVLTSDPMGVAGKGPQGPQGQQGQGQQGQQGQGQQGQGKNKGKKVGGSGKAGAGPGPGAGPTPVAQVLLPKPGVKRDVYPPNTSTTHTGTSTPTAAGTAHDHNHDHQDHQDHQTKAAEPDDQAADDQVDPDEDDDDTNTCFICAEPIKYWATGVCGHATCHVCAIRLRVFYKKTDCTFCKTNLPSLIFSSSPDTVFPSAGTIATDRSGPDLEVGQLDVKAFDFVDEKLGVVFDSQEMMEDVLLLLRFNCPSPSCSYQAASWDSLEKHTLSVHGAVLCHLCRRQLSRFAHEQILYPPHLLPLHDPSRVPRGHRKPKVRSEKEEEMVNGWGPPHPMCEFCHEAFFSSDELFKHMRHRHEECFVCKEMGKRDVYFHNYAQLASHFTQAHFPCTEKSCLEQKFVVFGSELDWKAHMVAEHNKTMSSRDKYQARQLPIDFVSSSSLGGDFSFTPPNPMPSRDQGSSRAPRHIQMEPAGQFTRQTGRHRPNAVQHQQLPQPPRDERNGRRAGFGNALTTEEDANESNANLKGRPAATIGTATPRIDESEEANEMQVELLERVATMVEYSETKLSSFRHAIRLYKNNEAPARDLVDTVYSVLNRDTEDTYRVVRRIADTMRGDDDKVQGILAALQSFKVDRQNEFPTLGGSATPVLSLGVGYSGIASGKVINAKKVTRTTGSASKVWDRVERAATSTPVLKPAASASMTTSKGKATTNSKGQKVPGAAFPSLGSGGAGGSGIASSSGWASAGAVAMASGGGGSGYSSAAQPMIRSVNMLPVSTSGNKKSRPPPPPSASAFPSLPAAASSRDRPNFARDDMVRRMKGDPFVPPVGWQGQGGSSSRDEMEEAAYAYAPADQPDLAQTNGGKKKKKGKEMLFSLGQARPSG